MAAGFASLCYHYVRPQGAELSSRVLLGASAAEFEAQLDALFERFRPVTPDEALAFSWPGDRPGLLFTFDDGLSDHLGAAETLRRRGIRALFFVPTCIYADGVPPNPTIIHYGLALHRLPGFLEAYREALVEEGLSLETYDVAYEPGRTKAWDAIGRLKETVNYRLPFKRARAVLLRVYERLLAGRLEQMHLTAEQTRELLAMGHSLGAHSHTHLSMKAGQLKGEDYDKELLFPKRFLEERFGAPVRALSYPFGEDADCLEPRGPYTEAYSAAFTAQPRLNTRETSRFLLGRYLPMSTDTPAGIVGRLEAL